MAQEITASAKLAAVKGGLAVRKAPSLTADMAGTRYVAGVQNVGTAAHEAIVMGDVGTAGVAVFINTSTTNTVDVGTEVSAAFVAFARLQPGEFWVGRLATSAPFAKASGGAVDLDYTILSA